MLLSRLEDNVSEGVPSLDLWHLKRPFQWLNKSLPRLRINDARHIQSFGGLELPHTSLSGRSEVTIDGSRKPVKRDPFLHPLRRHASSPVLYRTVERQFLYYVRRIINSHNTSSGSQRPFLPATMSEVS